jgi:hypothetical protein
LEVGRWIVWLDLRFALLAAALFFCMGYTVHGRDFGQWDRSSETSKWYRALMQPDNPSGSCCGEADACDDLHIKPNYNGQPHAYSTITDDRPDEPRRRKHIDIGTEIEIPDHKLLKLGQGNPTGHGVVFLSTGGFVYCYAMEGGV